MASSEIYAVISSHGFGHAARAAHVLALLQKEHPDVRLILNTSIPRKFFERILNAPFEIRNSPMDFGVVQRDGINLELNETLKRLQDLKNNQKKIIEHELDFIQSRNLSFLFGDIPFLLPEIAGRAGIPSVLMGNFGWDFIYSFYGGDFIQFAEWVSDCYSRTNLLLRLPFHEGMQAFPEKMDLNLTGGCPRFKPEQVLDMLGVSEKDGEFVLLTFGGMGLDKVPYRTAERFNGTGAKKITFLVYEEMLPEFSDIKNIINIDGCRLNPVDVMQICSAVITKPGYGMLSEALRVNCPVYALNRKNFSETPILIDSIRKYFFHRILEDDDFFQSDWSFLEEDMEAPYDSVPLALNGNEEAVRKISEYLK